MWPGDIGEPDDVDATTTISGTSHRLISPSALSSVRFATSGVTMLYGSVAPVHDHCSSGSKLFGGALSVHCGTPLSLSCTWHMSTGPLSPEPFASSPEFGRAPGPQATTRTTTPSRMFTTAGAYASTVCASTNT